VEPGPGESRTAEAPAADHDRGRLRIVAHNGAPVWGGAEIAITRLLAGLGRRGHDVRFYASDPEVVRRARAAGVRTSRLHLGGDIAVHHAVRFSRELDGWGPDALILGTFRKLWLGGMAARLARVPRVVARIGLETDMPRNAKYRFVFERWIDAIVFNADGMRERFLQAMPGYPGETVTIHTGVPNPAAGGGSSLRAELGIPADAWLVGSVGRLVSQKRYDRLVGAVAALPDIHLLVVGEGPEREALGSLAEERGAAGRVHLPGHRDEVGPALDAMDVFVVTSDREGMSNAMLEALAAGVPVVSTDVSGAWEALATREAGPAPGRVVGFEADELRSTLEELLADRRGLRAMGEAARRMASLRFDEDRMLTEWEHVLGRE
jgi:glycosyltransferase involved in cell wall biosynthesis